ncbi:MULTISPECIES: DUF3822 family protein [unclassified Algibacter]|uniref:DUF3822 family protein n=1 Tax=unclassified Algibacter TaxID=2615009 RepID=UPI00131AD568|nr:MULTISPECIES: DUF3822 family protein [unclassified Algibacter]MCL5128061.1 DUF3822 family protein [Algibacter sp. L4_22]
MAIANNKNNTASISKLINIELSIQISLSGLSFCTLNRDNNSISNLKEIKFKKQLNPLEVLEKLKHCFDTEAILQNKFEAINIIHDNELSTLVPKSIFNEGAIADYLKFNSKILKSDFITFDTIDSNQSVNVYIPYVNVNNYIYDLFGDFTYKHASTVLIETILESEKESGNSQFYAHINHNRFEIVITNKGELQFYNSFEYTTKEDFIYYILFTAEQLKLDPETLNLILIGDINKDDALYNIAYKYIRNVSLGNQKNNYVFNEEPETQYSNFTLINSF